MFPLVSLLNVLPDTKHKNKKLTVVSPKKKGTMWNAEEKNETESEISHESHLSSKRWDTRRMDGYLLSCIFFFSNEVFFFIASFYLWYFFEIIYCVSNNTYEWIIYCTTPWRQTQHKETDRNMTRAYREEDIATKREEGKSVYWHARSIVKTISIDVLHSVSCVFFSSTQISSPNTLRGDFGKRK